MKNCSIHLAVVLMLVPLTALPSPQEKSQTPTSSSPPLFSAGPITDYKAALPNTGDVLRFRRGERYNIQDPSLPELGEDSDTGIWNLKPSHFRKDAMPFAASDAIAIGIVPAGQAYLSNDKRDLYSEFKFSLLEVIKAPQPPSLRSGDAIDIQRRGGAVRLPSGKVLTRGAIWESMPRIGTRYLLFLKYDLSTEDYSISMGYELAGNEVYRLDELNEKDCNYSQIDHLLRGEGASESQFLVRTRAAFLSQKGGN
jgi:hypothetical protein